MGRMAKLKGRVWAGSETDTPSASLRKYSAHSGLIYLDISLLLFLAAVNEFLHKAPQSNTLKTHQHCQNIPRAVS